jgi:acetylornithine deacetylase/succinyl-diaminopimelate desuccinylase-like protein
VTEQTGVIDGAVHPDLIPDRVAYSLMFRLIANRQTTEEKSHIRAYIRHIGLADADVDGLIAAAEEFQQRVSQLDGEAKQIKASNRGSVGVQLKAHLDQLQRQKEAIADHSVVRLPLRLSSDAIRKLKQHVAEHVKQRVRVRVN